MLCFLEMVSTISDQAEMFDKSLVIGYRDFFFLNNYNIIENYTYLGGGGDLLSEELFFFTETFDYFIANTI